MIFSIAYAALVAIIAGLLSPKIYPMIPITAAFFMKSDRPLIHAVWFSAVLFALIVAIGSVSLLHPLIAVLASFAIVAIIVFDIQAVPYSVLTFTANCESLPGLVGVTFMATTCLLTWFSEASLAVSVSCAAYAFSPGSEIAAILTYAAVFSSPFFCIPAYWKLFPRKKIP